VAGFDLATPNNHGQDSTIQKKKFFFFPSPILFLPSFLPSQKLLFGEFFVTSAGYMQDRPFPFNRRNFNTFGILLGDRVVGEFELEIKYIRAVRRLLEIPEET